MGKLKLTLPGLEVPVTGKQVSFTAPCDCSAVEAIQIDGVDYDVVDSMGNVVPFGKGVWSSGAVLTVVLDVENHKAYLQSQNGYTRSETVTNATKALYGLNTDATPNDLFAVINNKFYLVSEGISSITITVKNTSGKPVKGVTVGGVYDISGAPVQTDSSGVINGYISEGSQTLSISGYADILDYSETISVARGTSYVKNITVTTRTYLKLLSSANYKFSGNVASVDVALGGAGGAGQPSSPATNIAGGYRTGDLPSVSSGAGGGMGSVTVKEGIVPEVNKVYSAIVGSGSNSSGGSSSFLGVTASGGAYGGGGKAATATKSTSSAAGNGASGTKSLYASETGTFLYGGSGGGGSLSSGGGHASNPIKCSYQAGTGGSPGGANGCGTGGATIQGVDGLGGGGSGGGFYIDYIEGSPYLNLGFGAGGRGGHGCITMRIHLAA